MKNLVILTTGGTIEKSYSEEEGDLENRESLLRKKLLEKLRLPHLDLSVKEVMAKDSLEMDDKDRQIIAEAIAKQIKNCDGVVVLHGTDTVDKTLSHCLKKLSKVNVPVVFTGAMKPAGFDDSDALQNFTEALLASQILEPGLYLSFHGQIFAADHFKKDKKKSTFVKI